MCGENVIESSHEDNYVLVELEISPVSLYEVETALETFKENKSKSKSNGNSEKCDSFTKIDDYNTR